MCLSLFLIFCFVRRPLLLRFNLGQLFLLRLQLAVLGLEDFGIGRGPASLLGSAALQGGKSLFQPLRLLAEAANLGLALLDHLILGPHNIFPKAGDERAPGALGRAWPAGRG